MHLLEPDPALRYQVFARDSSINVPQGPIVTQCHQWWRRGEYSPVIRFYQENDIPIHRMITAAALEGGDFMIVEPGVAVIGNGEERAQEPAARQLAGWLEADGWEVRIERIRPHFLHSTCSRRCSGRSSPPCAWSRWVPGSCGGWSRRALRMVPCR